MKILMVFLLMFWAAAGQAGDFDELNALLKDALIYIGDTSVAEGLILNLSIKNLRCTNFAIGDMHILSTRQSASQVQLDIKIVDLNMNCFLDYEYTTLIFSGSGRAQVDSNGNDASAISLLTSSDFDQYPPTSVSLESCSANINLSNLQFLDGGILALAPVESLLARVVEGQAQRLICNQLQDLTTTRLVEMLASAKDTLDDYPPGLQYDPLVLERQLVVPEAMKLLNMRQRETEVGELFEFALEEAVTFLSKMVVDDKTAATDMRINVLLRSLLLEDRALLLDVADFSFVHDGVLWEKEDKLTNTKIVLNSIKLLGLDTFTRFQPYETIGNYTVQNELSWKHLTFELDATIDIRASRSPDSVVVNPGNTNVVERIIVKFGVENLDAVASFLLAVDQDVLESIQVGSLLNSDDILSCVLSTFFKVEMPTLSVDLTKVQVPTLEGFVSPGLDRAVSSSVLAAFRMYEAALLKAAPSFFQKTVRAALNKSIQASMQTEVAKGGCPWMDIKLTPTDFIDFRDLLLDPVAAEKAGGSGTQPYGDVVAVFTSQMNDRFLLSGNDGFPKINTAIRPATEAQSGVSGELRLKEPYALLRYNASSFKTLLKEVEVRSSSIAISNLDTIVQPLKLLSVAGAQNLTSSIIMGKVPLRPLTFSTELLFRIDGDDSPLAVENLFELTASIENSITFDIGTKLLKQDFLEFPLKNVLNINCWLAALPATDIDEKGNIMDRSSVYDGLQLSNLMMIIEQLDFDIKCISCSSAGGEALPALLSTMKESGATSIIEERFQSFLNEMAWGYWDSLELHNYIAEAKKTCPHSPYYDQSVSSSFEWPGLPSLSREAMESMIVFAMIATDFGMVLTAKSHLFRSIEPSDPLSSESNITFPMEGELVDWNDLSGSVGDWASPALTQIRSYMGDMKTDESSGEIDLGGNLLVRDFLDDGALRFESSEFSLGTAGGAIQAKAGQIRLFGLDAMLQAEILNPLGNYTLSNQVQFETLRIEIDVQLKYEDSMEIATFSVSLNDVDVNVALLIAMDIVKLGSLQVGSVLRLKKVFPCMVSRLHEISATQLLVTAQSIEEPQLVGFLSNVTSSSLRETSSRFLSNFTSDLISSIPKICDTTIRGSINALVREFSANEELYCSYNSIVSQEGIIDFRDLFLTEALAVSFGGTGVSPYGDTFRIIFHYIQEELSALNESNETVLNEMFIHPMTFNQSGVNGSLLFPDKVFNVSSKARLSTWEISIEGRISNVRVENLDSIGETLKLLQPVRGQASVLNNSITVGVGDKPLRLAATVFLLLQDDNEMHLQNEVDVVLEIDTLTIVLTVFLAMSESLFFSLPLDSLQDLNCWMASISQQSFETSANVSSWFRYGISAKEINLNISCVSCESPLFGELIEQLYSPGKTQEEAETFVETTKAVIDQFLGSDFLQNLVQNVVSSGATACPASPSYDPLAAPGSFLFQPETYLGLEAAKRDSKMVVFNIVNAIVAVIFFVGGLFARWYIQRRNRIWLQTLPEDHVKLLHLQDEMEALKEIYLNENTESMFRSDQIPRRIRYAVPVVLVLNIVLYLVAHIAVLSYINLEANIAGDHFTVEQFLEFAFFDAAIRTFRNGGREMSFFLILCSGIWPYIKLVGALALWFIPPTRLSVARRGKLFLWMDAVTKLSIIDIVTMILGVAAFLVYIGGPGSELYNSDELYALTLVVVPQSGFYCIVIAQRMNRVSSLFFLDYHDKIVTVASEEYKRRHRSHYGQDLFYKSETTFDTATISKVCSSESNLKNVSFEDNVDESLESPSPCAIENSNDSIFEDCSEDSSDCLSQRSRCYSNKMASNESMNKTLESQLSRMTDKSISATFDGRLESPLSCAKRSDTIVKFDDSIDKGFDDRRIVLLTTNGTSDFLLYDQNDQIGGKDVPHAVGVTEIPNTLWGRLTEKSRHMLGGSLAVIFAGIFVLILFVIGCTLAPSMSMDAKEVLSVVLESGRSYEDAVKDFNVFRMVSRVLLKTRFVLNSTADYVGLGILLSVAGLSAVLFPCLNGWKKLKEWYTNRKEGTLPSSMMKSMKRKSVIPGFTNQLKVWNHMEVFVISFCIANWQLGAVIAYLIHNYCDLLNRLYEALGYVGLIERTTANCFRVQSVDPFTILIIMGSFFLLLFSFILQMVAQYKKNKAHIEELLDEE